MFFPKIGQIDISNKNKKKTKKNKHNSECLRQILMQSSIFILIKHSP